MAGIGQCRADRGHLRLPADQSVGSGECFRANYVRRLESGEPAVIELLLGLPCFLLVICGVSLIVGVVVFAPLYEAGQFQYSRWQFRLSDFAILLVHLQLAAGAALAVFHGSPVSQQTAIVAAVWIVLTLWWLSGIHILGRAKIFKVQLRLLVLGLILPIGYGLSLAFVASPAIMAIHAGAIVELIISGGRNGGSPFLLMTAVEISMVAIFMCCRRLCCWVLVRNGARPSAAGPGGDD
jgi:hypothetical protein